MCDCYYTKCALCDEYEISVHIANFCTGRGNVKVVCPDCTYRKAIAVSGSNATLYFQKVTSETQVIKTVIQAGDRYCPEFIGRQVTFIVTDVDAYGVELN